MADLHDRHIYLLTEDERRLVHGGPALIAPDGTRHDIPIRVYDALRDVEQTLRSGKAVQLRTLEEEVSIGEAADLMRMDTDTVRFYMDRGDLPYHRVGTVPWMRLADVLEFDRRRREEQAAALQDMADEEPWDESPGANR
jgi:hypothetical protein